jgi:hypothetical protein
VALLRQEVERNDEVLRSCGRSLVALKRLGESASSQSFAALLAKVEADPRLKPLLHTTEE